MHGKEANQDGGNATVCGFVFHEIDGNDRRSEEEEDRCFLSVLLFNYRNNGRFPFQLIILLVSRPHCTRTGRHNLIVGIVLKYTWYRGMFNVKRQKEAIITLTANCNNLKQRVDLYKVSEINFHSLSQGSR